MNIIKADFPTPIERLNNIGKAMRIKKALEEKGVGIPKYSQEQKDAIRKEAIEYFNLDNLSEDKNEK